MQHLEVSGEVRPIYGSLGFKRLIVPINCKIKHKSIKGGTRGFASWTDLNPYPANVENMVSS